MTFPDKARCDDLNTRAVFHPQICVPDEKPYIEVAGIQVYAYLDPDDQTVRVSIHLDDANTDLLSGGNVPLEIDVGGTIVYAAS
ncbi:hypothetical protein AB0395_21945 [Streptosporangium sp. NPDC051023]|uniref:hypothetical protein n=1 Tax=Streptosporangium sp. NPDC051023 TaxID=3155410 RepID=UPI00344C4F28